MISSAFFFQHKRRFSKMTAKMRLRSFSIYFVIFLTIVANSAIAPPGLAADSATNEQLQSIRNYIKRSWKTLTRSNARLADAAVDPKFHPAASGRWPVYLSRKENFKQVEQSLRSQMSG